MVKIPLVDLQAQYRTIQAQVIEAIRRVVETGRFIGGAEVSGFEREFAACVGGAHVVGCANGTDAIELALEAFGVGAGDEVIVPAHTWISTSEAVSRVGATPVFVDTDPETHTIDPRQVRHALTRQTKAVIAVHLFGQPCDMDELRALTTDYELWLLEDCAQAHGATYRGSPVGVFGDAATFSFFPSKNLGAYGDAGAVVTRSDVVAARVRMIANHGQLARHDHRFEGRNSRLDAIQAAILRVKLPYLAGWVQRRQQIAARYMEQLNGLALRVPIVADDTTHAFHVFAVRLNSNDRAYVASRLLDEGVETGVHYPQALPDLPAYSGQTARARQVEADCPNASAACARLLSLPMYPEMTDDQVDQVVAAMRSVLA